MGKIVGYVKAKFINEGTVISDNRKRQWLIGKQLGEGGFGTIYMASELPRKEFENVIKIEPSSNGPLYTEIKFYTRVCKEQEIANWIKEKNLKFLGVPKYISDGLFLNNENRFLVMDRYGEDLHKILMNSKVTYKCLLQIAINIVDILEYIHSREYSHADIKALNILKGFKNPSQIYLLDFGMVTKFAHNGEHKPEKPDPKLKNNGTVEFCPRDSHRGLISCRRSDIESLMFNLIFWLTWDKNRPNPSERVGYGNLPWMSHLKSLGNKSPSAQLLNKISDSKEKYMNEPKSFIEEVDLNNRSFSNHILDVLKYTSHLKYCEKPDYDYIRNQFGLAICEIDCTPLSKMNLKLLREIRWDEPETNKQRKSSTFNQAVETRKRSSDTLDSSITTIKKRSRSKKCLLEINNSNSENGELSNKSLLTKKSKTAPVEVIDVNGIAEKIPKFAMRHLSSKIKNQNFGLKENNSSASIPGTVKPKRTAIKKKVTEKIDISPYNQIIPGVKELDQLKQKVIYKHTPRIRARRKNASPSSKSVSCQTSP